MILPPAVAPSDDVALVLQAAAAGALFGTAVAVRRRGRNPDADAWLLTARWSVVGAIIGFWIVVGHGLGWW